MLDITTLSQLGGTIVTVLLFLGYLRERDVKWAESLKGSADSNVLLAVALQRLTDRIIANSTANTINTQVIDRNVNAVRENTQTVRENTENIHEKIN